MTDDREVLARRGSLVLWRYPGAHDVILEDESMYGDGPEMAIGLTADDAAWLTSALTRVRWGGGAGGAGRRLVP